MNEKLAQWEHTVTFLPSFSELTNISYTNGENRPEISVSIRDPRIIFFLANHQRFHPGTNSDNFQMIYNKNVCKETGEHT